MNWKPEVHYINDYATETSYLNAIAASIHNHWQKQTPGSKLLFSFHGVPEKLIKKGDPYYDQCHHTAENVAKLLQLDCSKWEIVFQSRFGREKWLKPYCNQVLIELPKKGIKHVDVVCPGFSVDCLETLEEMAMTNKQLFHSAGGLIYNYIPALNDSKIHVHSLLKILSKKIIAPIDLL